MSIKTAERDARAGSHALKRAERRWVAWVTWMAILAPVPYGVSRLRWAAGVPVGIDEWLLHDLGAPGWGSIYIAFLALL
jgi:hypothetical protein